MAPVAASAAPDDARYGGLKRQSHRAFHHTLVAMGAPGIDNSSQLALIV